MVNANALKQNIIVIKEICLLSCHLGWMNRRRFCLQKGGSQEHARSEISTQLWVLSDCVAQGLLSKSHLQNSSRFTRKGFWPAHLTNGSRYKEEIYRIPGQLGDVSSMRIRYDFRRWLHRQLKKNACRIFSSSHTHKVVWQLTQVDHRSIFITTFAVLGPV